MSATAAPFPERASRSHGRRLVLKKSSGRSGSSLSRCAAGVRACGVITWGARAAVFSDDAMLFSYSQVGCLVVNCG